MSHEEGMPFVVNPGVIDPEQFLNEVLTVRFPNPFMPDTPAAHRDRYLPEAVYPLRRDHQGVYRVPDHEASELRLIPLVLAGWLRYLIGVDDAGKPFACSPDPLLEAMQAHLAGMTLGGEIDAESCVPFCPTPLFLQSICTSAVWPARSSTTSRSLWPVRAPFVQRSKIRKRLTNTSSLQGGAACLITSGRL